MKRTTLIAALAAAMFTTLPAMAEQPASAAKGAHTQQKAPNVTEFDKQMAQAQENMKKMQEQMDQLSQTQDPQERQKLLQEHWGTMQNNMQMMHGMWGQGMMGCCAGGHMMNGGMMDGHMMNGGMMDGHMMNGHMMGWGGMKGYYSKLTPDQMKQRQYMMDQYMGMQQMMMDHMMQQQNYMWMQSPR